MVSNQRVKGECFPPANARPQALKKPSEMDMLTVETSVSVLRSDCCCLEWARMRSILARWWMSQRDPTRVIGAVQQMQLLPAMNGLHFSALGRGNRWMDSWREAGRVTGGASLPD